MNRNKNRKQAQNNNIKLRIAVLMGGPSSEHDVSLRTGEMIVRHLDPYKYAAEGIVISKETKWPLTIAGLKRRFDFAFIAMHGEYGEDGTVQALLDKHRILYTGSGARASRLGMDKARSARVFQRAGLLVPQFAMTRGEKFSLLFGFPVVVKPVDRGSSVGVSIVRTIRELPVALRSASGQSSRIMFQQYIPGREVTCGVLEINGKPKALLPTEIVPQHRTFFDYYSKYTAGVSKEITPPRLPQRTIKKIQKIAVTAHKAIGARGFSRTDMILEKNPKSEIRNPKLWVLEINTIPGMTETSLLPQQAKAIGIEFPKLLDYIIEAALRKNSKSFQILMHLH